MSGAPTPQPVFLRPLELRLVGHELRMGGATVARLVPGIRAAEIMLLEATLRELADTIDQAEQMAGMMGMRVAGKPA